MNLQYHSKQAGLGQIERHIIDLMTRLDKVILTAADLEAELAYTQQHANLVLSRLCKKGWLQRLKPGIYHIIPLGSDTPEPMPEDPWAIAMALFSPCYISGWTAAEHWELTEQIFNTTVVFTEKKQRKKSQLIAGLSFLTKSIPAEEIFGTKKIWSSNKPILIADIHRVIIDVLDDPQMGGGGRHALDIIKAYWQKNEADPDILLQYAEKLGHGAVFKRLGFVAEKIMHLPSPWLEKLRLKIKTGIINFDPNGIDSGPIITKWGVRINLPSGDIL